MDNLSAVESIFFTAMEKSSPEERAAYLDGACGADADLRQRVERLLRAQPNLGNFLDVPAPGLGATVDEPLVAERPGASVGPYKLMEQIGEGGMGLVFVAEQQFPVRRKVALKVIKPGMDSRSVIARFEAERQALALMDHPNIARVLDAGTTDSGRPYFVMELVKGVRITDYCDQNQLTPRERLELFVSVCKAVQHAHQKGIIHRDLKPSNVLVTLHDGTPVVKVIDFGVAKAVGQQLTEKTIYTGFAQMIGTPLYMSPEQAEMSGLDVDTRCDVYSLGVLLYELLTGTTPFDRLRLEKAAFDEIRRIIREEEPPRPSTRLTTLNQSLSSVSAQRKTEPRKLSALVRGDLDWIVMKALEKDRARRYDTASAFAADVRRHLDEEPVEARPPSALYRFRKFARRHKMALTTATLISAALVLGMMITAWLALLATRARMIAQVAQREALANREKAMQARDRAMEAVRLADKRLAQTTKEKERAEQAELQAKAEAAITRTFADSLRKGVVAGRATEVEPELVKLLEGLRRARGANDPDVLQAMKALAVCRMAQKKFNEAAAVYVSLLEGRRKTRGDKDPETLDVMLDLANAHLFAGKGDQAEALAKQVIDVSRRASSVPAPPKGAGPEEKMRMDLLRQTYVQLRWRGVQTLGMLASLQGKSAQAARLNAESIEGLTELLLPQKMWGLSENALRGVLKQLETNAPEDWRRFNLQSLLGDVLTRQKKYAEAEPLLLAGYEGLKAREQAIPAEDKNRLVRAGERLVRLYEAWGKKEKADEWRKKLP